MYSLERNIIYVTFKSHVYMYIQWSFKSIHSSFDEHLGWFHNLVNINSATIN